MPAADLWKRVSGLRAFRAALAVGSAMLACRLFHLPAGAAALGVFFALLADTGGPYQLRLKVILAVTMADAVALTCGLLVPNSLPAIALITTLICFILTYGRVLSQTWTSLSTFVLVAYFAGLGAGAMPFTTALETAAASIAGGAWAMLLSLALWPVDPFRPARAAVAACFHSLSDFTRSLAYPRDARDEQQREADRQAAHTWQRQQRPLMEAARLALSATTTRAPSRTVRARSLTVLLETSDLLLARTMRLTELADLPEGALPPGARSLLNAQLLWLAGTTRDVAIALDAHPADGAVAFAAGGSVWSSYIKPAPPGAAQNTPAALNHLVYEQQTATAELEVIFNAVYSFWNGANPERAAKRSAADHDPSPEAAPAPAWRDALGENWTFRSINLRHSLRLTLVGLIDVVLMHVLNVNHSFWLPMTSIILLQPYLSGSLRRSLERITGTVLGGILAAVLAAALPDTLAMTAVITLLAGLTVATYGINYAVYCFFLTPTFVLLALPHAHDWRFAGVRIGLTLAGAAISMAAMRLLWPARAQDELASLLRRSLAADAAYLQTMIDLWTKPQGPATARLAAARRACGLASNDAEEAIDRIMQEPALGTLTESELILRGEALTLATYVRRFTQSVTTLAEVGRPTPRTLTRLKLISDRLDRAAASTPSFAEARRDPQADVIGPMLLDVAEEQMLRLDRQSRVLERAAAAAFATSSQFVVPRS